jgi:hypothetical protein
MPSKFDMGIKRLQHKLDCMQRVYDCIAANPGIQSAEIYRRLGVVKSTAQKWLRWLCEDCLIQRTPGIRRQHGSLPDTFVAIGPRPEVLPDKKEGKKIPGERVRRYFVKAKNCGMAPDPLALPREFFGAPAA